MYICFVVFFIILFENSFCQVPSISQILQSSKSYYESLTIFSVNVIEKFKPPVAEDTTIIKHRCFINSNTGDKLFLGLISDKGIFISQSNEYIIDLEMKSYVKTRDKDRKHTAYNKTHQFYPFVDVNNFISRIANRSLSIRETSTEYILSNNSYLYVFRKSNFSIKRFAKFGYDKKYKGRWIEETNFSECVENDTLAATFIDSASEIILSDENETYWAKKRLVAPTTFDRSIFSKKNLRIANNDIESFDNKIIFLDFFYSSCIPCYKSHPFVNKLYENRDSNFLVIGIDPVLSDTLHIYQFLKRFNIKHPVIIGEGALQISKIPGVVNGYPTFLVIGKDGKILEYWNGHSEKFLRGVEKKYLERNNPN